MGEYYNAKEIRMKQEITKDLNTLFELIDRFSDQYRFHLTQLNKYQWQARFERMDKSQLLGDVLATEDTVAKAIGLALLLVRTQTQTGKE